MEKELLKKLEAFYVCQIKKEDKYYLLSAHSYNPYGNFPENCIRIDAYYPASNRMYMKCRAFARERGAHIVNDVSYKRFALASGEFTLGFNDLLIHELYGSYFVLNIMALSEPLELPVIPYRDDGRGRECCFMCGLCERLCPGGALSGQGFDRSRCLRGMMEESLSMDNFMKLGDCLLGCETCRDCCPHNSSVIKTDPPEKLIQLMDIERLLVFDKETREKLGEIIGRNMARASVLLPVAIAGACRRRKWGYISIIERLLMHESERVREAAGMGMEYYALCRAGLDAEPDVQIMEL